MMSGLRKTLGYLLIFLFLFSYNGINAQSDIVLSGNAGAENSIKLLDVLRKEYHPDTLLTYIENNRQFIIVCRTNLSGNVKEIECFRNNRRLNWDNCVTRNPNDLFFANVAALREILLNCNEHFVFPIDISCQYDGFIDKHKEYLADLFNKNGFILLDIPCFDMFMSSRLNNIKKKYKGLTNEQLIDKLISTYVPEHY